MDNSWIKLYRKIIKHELYHDNNAFKVFVFLLATVDKSTGKDSTGRKWIAMGTKLPESTVYEVLKRLQNKYHVISLKANKRFTEVTILKWSLYQSNPVRPDESTDNKPTLTQQQPNTITRIKNKEIRDKSLMGIHPEEGNRYGEPEVNLILDAFKGNISHIPADRKPRSVAHNVRQLIHTFIKRNGDAFERVRGVPLTFDYVHLKSWEWYMQKDYAPLTEKLEAFKSKMKVYLDDVEGQLKKEMEVYEQTAN